MLKASKSIAVLFSYVVYLAIVVGANPLDGETIAPMDLLLSYPGWDAAEFEGVVTHHERSDILDGRLPTWIKLKSAYRSGDPALWESVGAYGRLGTFQMTNSVFSPSFLLFVTIDDDALAYYLAVLVNLLIAAIGTYVFLRLFLGRPAAWFGGAIFAVVGFNAAWLYWHHVTTSCWIPWLMWAVAGWTMRRQPIWTFAIAVTSMMLILGGFPTVAVYGFYAAILLMIVLSLAPERRDQSTISAGFVSLFSIGIGFALAALPILGLTETLSLLDLSYRRGGGLDWFENWMLFFNPYANGLPRVGHTVYAGLVATGMAIAVIVLLFTRKMKNANHVSLAVFALLALAGSIVFAFGLLPRAILSNIPGIGTSNWIRVFVISGLCIAILAALFTDCAVGWLRKTQLLSLRATGYALLIALAVVQAADQTNLFRKFNYVTKEGEFLPETPSITHVRDNLRPLQSAVADWAYMVSGTLGSYHIPEWFTHAFRADREKATLERLVRSPFVTPTAARFPAYSIQWDSPLMDMLGVAFVLAGKEDFRPVIPRSFRNQPLGGHKAAPAMPANSLKQEFTLEGAHSLYAVGLVLATYHRPRAPSDVRLSVFDFSGRAVASTITKAGHVKDNKEAIFEFDSPVHLAPGRYRMTVELINPTARGRLTAWWVDRPAHPDDAMLINGDPRPGAMIYTLYTAEPFNEKEWLVMQHKDEPSTLLLKNRRVPGGAYFVRELDENADWSDDQATTRVIDNQTIEIDYSGEGQGFIVLPMRYYPGWRMTADGEPAGISVFLGMLPAVPVDGPVALRYTYRPEWLEKGIVITVAGFLALVVQFFALRIFTRRRKRLASGG